MSEDNENLEKVVIISKEMKPSKSKIYVLLFFLVSIFISLLVYVILFINEKLFISKLKKNNMSLFQELTIKDGVLIDKSLVYETRQVKDFRYEVNWREATGEYLMIARVVMNKSSNEIIFLMVESVSYTSSFISFLDKSEKRGAIGF